MHVNPGDSFCFEISEAENGERFDIFMTARLHGISRSQISSLIKDGLILIDNTAKKPGYRLRWGEKVAGFIPLPTSYSCEPQDIFIETLYEDQDIIVINKPPGLVVHPAPGHESGTLVNALIAKCPDLQGIGGELRPGIVHRLDKDTSGLLIAAKNQVAHNALIEMFMARSVEKKYFAVAVGVIDEESGVIDRAIGRHSIDRKKMSVSSKRGKESLTFWKVVERFKCATLVEVEIKTGRTHQIRVHLDSIGHPVAGDQVYGDKKNLMLKRQIGGDAFPVRQMLHSWNLVLRHPVSGNIMNFQAGIPDDMNIFIESLRNCNLI